MKLWCAVTMLAALIASPASALGVGQHWPTQLVLKDMQGRAWQARAWRGRVIVVGVWASWCEPCGSSMAELSRLYHQFDRASVAVFGVSIDADASDVRNYLKAHPVAFPVIHDGDHVLVKRIGVRSIPSVFVIDKQGTLRRVFAGPARQNHAQLRKTIAGLLATKIPTKAGFVQNE